MSPPVLKNGSASDELGMAPRALSPRQISLVAASSVGKWPRVLMILRSWALMLSMALGVFDSAYAVVAGRRTSSVIGVRLWPLAGKGARSHRRNAGTTSLVI